MAVKRRLVVTGGILVVWLAAVGGYLVWSGEGQNPFASRSESAASEAHYETRVLPAFNGVRITGPVSVSYQAAPEVSVKVIAPEDEAGLIATSVDDKTLVVEVKSGFIEGKEAARVEIHGPSPSMIDIAGSANFTAEGLKSSHLALKSAGAGTIKLAGDVQSLNVSTSGAGSIDTSALKASGAQVSSAGASTIRVFAAKSIAVAGAGAGKVTVLGKPAERSVQSVGAVRVSFE